MSTDLQENSSYPFGHPMSCWATKINVNYNNSNENSNNVEHESEQ